MQQTTTKFKTEIQLFTTPRAKNVAICCCFWLFLGFFRELLRLTCENKRNKLYFFRIMWYFVAVMLNKRLQNWLTETGTTRAELAEKLHVKPRTVDSWLGQKNLRPIPKNKVEIIERMIKPQVADGEIPLTLRLSPEQWEELTKDLPPGTDVAAAMKKRLLAFLRAAKIE